MKKINLTKYGFIRTPEEDFSDDGNRFTCYKVGKVRVSKLVDRGDVYIAADMDDCRLHHKEYSTLPHYKSLNALNGISLEDITEKDLLDLYNACIEYEKEYEEKVKEVQALNPSYEHILDCLTKINEVRQKEVADIESKTSLDNLYKLSEYNLKTFFGYFKCLKRKIINDIKAEADSQSKSINGYTRSFYNTDRWQNELKPDWYYQQCLEILGYEQ